MLFFRKKSLKFWLNVLLYVAFLLLIWMLIKFDYLQLKNISIDSLRAIFAVFFLFSGYLLLPPAWKSILNRHGIAVSYRESIISEGKPVFAKYLPGKFMVLIGRAGYISLKGFPLTRSSVISFKAQMISLMVNLMLGFIAFGFLPVNFSVVAACILLLFSLFLFLYIKPIHDLLIHFIQRIFKNTSSIPCISPGDTIAAFMWYLAAYTLWGLGFAFLCFAVSGHFSLINIPLFSLATSVSIIAFVFPGGLGVREGVIVYFLTLSGLNIETSTLISILSRLWFIFGELFYFLIAVILSARKR